VTSNHPFWSADRQAFVEAGQLQVGEQLQQADGTLVQITRITPHTGPPVEVYNLEVDAEHVYHVGAGGVLVHNTYPTVTVIGERMGRVKEAVRVLRSQGVNASYYKAWTKYWPRGRQLTDIELAANLRRNADWVRRHMRAGDVFVDIGTEIPGQLDSPFYLLENLILNANDYPTVHIPGF
jgi:rhodanese-related sulfurtransferase